MSTGWDKPPDAGLVTAVETGKQQARTEAILAASAWLGQSIENAINIEFKGQVADAAVAEALRDRVHGLICEALQPLLTFKVAPHIVVVVDRSESADEFTLLAKGSNMVGDVLMLGVDGKLGLEAALNMATVLLKSMLASRMAESAQALCVRLGNVHTASGAVLKSAWNEMIAILIPEEARVTLTQGGKPGRKRRRRGHAHLALVAEPGGEGG